MPNELEELADAAALAGGESAITSMLKGMADGISDLVRLAKGGPEDLEEGEEGEGEDTEEEGEEGDPGYADLETLGKGDEYIDVSEFIEQVGGDVTELRKAVAAQDAKIAQLTTLTIRQSAALAKVLGPLTKGVAGIDTFLRESTGGVSSVAQANLAGVRKLRKSVGKGRGVGGDFHGLTMIQLAKASGEGVIGSNQLARWKATGTFSDDEAENTKILTAVQAAAA